MKRTLIVTVVLCISVLIMIPGGLAQVSKDEVQLALNISYEEKQEMLDANFPVTRINDLLAEAGQLFTVQSALEDTGGIPNYELVIKKTVEISKIKKQAFDAYDGINALELAIDETQGINKTAVSNIVDNAKLEFKDERYDKADEFIEKAYEKISEEQALSTKVRFFLDTARKNIVSYIIINWVYISAGVILVVVFTFLFHGELSKFQTKRKIKRLDIRKDVLNELIKKVQHEYFEIGKLSGSTYKIKMRKFEEMLRDIERMKPLLREELEKHGSILSKFRKRS